MKIKTLTKSQEEALARYRELGIKIGMKADPSIDEEKVRELTDAHRVLCGLQPAEVFTVMDSPFAACTDGRNPGNALYGQHDISWLSFYLFFRVECGLTEETDAVKYLIELASHVGWMWMNETTTTVTRRPSEIHTRRVNVEDGSTLDVLHNTDAMALQYVDGTGVYALNGIRIPKEYHWVITTPADSLDMQKVLGIQNTEIRTEVLKKIGIEKAFDSLKKKLLDEGEVATGGHYSLYKVYLGEKERVYLQGNCPSKGDLFFEAVPPECSTITEALSWREEGTITLDYTPPMVRT